MLFVPGIGHAYPDRRGICLTFCGTFSKHTCPQGYECRSNGCGHECYRPMNFQVPASKYSILYRNIKANIKYMYYIMYLTTPSFVWCVWAFDFANWLGTFRFEFSSAFSIFVIFIYFTPFASMVLRNDDSPSEGDDKWLTRVKREPYFLQVKDIFIDFEKEQANAVTRQYTRTRKVKRD